MQQNKLTTERRSSTKLIYETSHRISRRFILHRLYILLLQTTIQPFG